MATLDFPIERLQAATIECDNCHRQTTFSFTGPAGAPDQCPHCPKPSWDKQGSRTKRALDAIHLLLRDPEKNEASITLHVNL